MRRKKAVTLQDVADQLGLTVHTVSKALRGLPGMSESTRREVLECARSMGYRTKAQEAGLSAERIPWIAGKPRRFAMILSGDSRDFDHPQLEGVQQRLGELGHTLHPLIVPRSLTCPSELEKWLETGGIAYTEGLFFTAALAEWVEAKLLALPMPKVFINFPPDSAAVDSVIWDIEHAVHLSMDYLYRCGHRNILYIGRKEPHRGFQLRWKAFQAASERLGLMHEADANADYGHMTGSTADRATWMEALRQRLESGKYTAVLCAIADDAEWVLATAASARIDIPEQLSVIAIVHEEDPRAPELTRPELPIREVGERAAELMLRRLANPALPYEYVKLKGPLYEGGTVRSLHQ